MAFEDHPAAQSTCKGLAFTETLSYRCRACSTPETPLFIIMDTQTSLCNAPLGIYHTMSPISCRKSYFFLPLVLSMTSIQFLFTPRFSSAL